MQETRDGDEAVLFTIGEDRETAEDEHGEDEEAIEKELETAKTETAAVAAAAQKEMLELNRLLGNLETGTDTRVEKEDIKALHSKLSQAKNAVVRAKRSESKAELKLLRSRTGRKVKELKTAIKERQVQSVVKSVCAAESVDMAFVIDVTGSMASHIENVCAKIREIVRKIRSINKSLRLRLAVVAYRDIGDSNRFEVLDFVSNVETFEGFVGNLEAAGGDDTAEDIAGGIKKANGLSWSLPTRVVFLIADAPCHGREYHDEDDSYPSGTPGIGIVAELKKLLGNHDQGTMTVHFGRINSSTDKMINRLDEQGIKLDVVPIENAERLTASVTKGVRQSIFKTITATGSGMNALAFAPTSDINTLMRQASGRSDSSISLKDYTIRPRTPSSAEWKRLPAVHVQVYRNMPIRSIDDLQAPIEVGLLGFRNSGRRRLSRARTDETKQTTMYMRLAPEPFAEGGIRIAYHGQLSRKTADLNSDKSAFVMKSFKHHGKGLNDRQQYFKQMEVSNIAEFLAKKYNASRYRPDHCGKVRVLQNYVVEEEEDVKEGIGQRRYCAESILPDGTFTKFSNNTGYWSEDALDETLLRFSIYTYKATNGYLMVTDLQGVQKGSDFYLTDPAILCTDILRFGNTNLGEEFMKKCIDATYVLMEENRWR